MVVLLKFIVFVVCHVWVPGLVSATGPEGPLIKTNSGSILGRHIKSYDGRTVSAFEGIPYAKPPVGTLRFEKAEPIHKWTNILVADKTYMCIQSLPTKFSDTVIGTEDCLYLYVYVPRENITGSENLDVAVGFHSGAFMRGDPHSLCGPGYLMDRDLIYVTMNYRLGVLGFLSTEDDVLPGNNGLKDQVLAMRWIKDNIKHFGGNPNSITLTGVSAGGASVHYHYLSPMSQDLFHRGLSTSGTVLNSWVLTENPAKKARNLARLLNCTTESSNAMVSCLQQLEPELIILASGNFFAMYKRLPLTPFGPVVEKGRDPFLPVHPYKLLLDGHVKDVPWISSNTIDEGLLATGEFVRGGDLAALDKNWDILIPQLADCNDTMDDEYKPKLGEKLREFYLKEQTLTMDNVDKLAKLFSDRYFLVDAEEAARLHATVVKSPVYYYFFTYKLEMGVPFTNKFPGIAHMDDARLMYPIQGNPNKLSRKDEKLKNIFIDFFAEFASGKIPQIGKVDWKPLKPTDKEISYLHISGPDTIQMESAEEVGSRGFWNTLPIRENQYLYENKVV